MCLPLSKFWSSRVSSLWWLLPCMGLISNPPPSPSTLSTNRIAFSFQICLPLLPGTCPRVKVSLALSTYPGIGNWLITLPAISIPYVVCMVSAGLINLLSSLIACRPSPLSLVDIFMLRVSLLLLDALLSLSPYFCNRFELTDFLWDWEDIFPWVL